MLRDLIVAKGPRAGDHGDLGLNYFNSLRVLAPVSLLALWFGAAPFISAIALQQLIDLFTLAVPDRDEASPALTTHVQAARGTPAPPSFSALYSDIVCTAIATNEDSAGPTATVVGSDAVALCLAITRTTSCLVTLKAAPLNSLLEKYSSHIGPVPQSEHGLLFSVFFFL